MAVKQDGVIWICSFFLRFLWAFLPQTGYIHPDEYFQSPEVVASDIFGFKALRTWEFNPNHPIRSILLPHVFSGIPFRLLQLLQALTPWKISSRQLIIAPRIMFCVLSTLTDFCAFKIACLLQVDPAPILAVLGTSYVTLVFNTRPFSNSLESILFALLLWLYGEHMFSKGKTKKRIVNLGIGMALVAGVWNRPTFLAYALTPGVFWCYSFFREGVLTKEIVKNLLKEACFIGIGVLCCSFVFVLSDSLYFGHLTITPLNFIEYNMDPSHLKDHGLHPRFTHFIVNVPLLFGILGGVYYYHLIVKVCTAKMNDQSLSTPKSHLFTAITISIIVPTALLSLFPHQEPRFLVPLLLPLSILFAHLIIGQNQFSFLAMSWFLWNVVGCLIFGVLHQGGMYPCLQYLQSNLPIKPLGTKPVTFHVIFSNTYMPPRHLLAWPSCEIQPCSQLNRHYVHDLGGQTNAELTSMLKQFTDNIPKDQENQVFLVCPSTLYFHDPDFHKIQEFFPHLTLENPPNIASFMDIINGRQRGMPFNLTSTEQARHFLQTWLSSNLSLNLYKYKKNSNMRQKN